MIPSPAKVAAIVPTAPEDWAIEVVNHPAATAFIGEIETEIKSFIFGARAEAVFLINSIERIKR